MSSSEIDPRVAYAQKAFQAPAGATDLLLIRHGQSEGMSSSSYPRLPSGQADPALSPLGHQQAVRMGERLGDVGIQAIYCSTLIRTQQTAAPLANFTGLDPVVVPELREVELGEWEGGEFRKRSQEKDASFIEMMRTGDWGVVPGGETNEAFGSRVRGALEKIQAAHPAERVAVVCHGGVIGIAIALATGCSPMAFMHVDNASITQMLMVDDLWIVRRVNDTAHLGPAFPPVTDEEVM
ncbi:MAG TPA: histidine phosphatase family protein [Sporichthya sp.]|nr:histidine phosphatase family protein [Sporichthya sp.]